MIHLYSYLHFSAALLFALLALHVLLVDPRSSLNRLSALFLGCFLIWSFGQAFVHMPQTGRDTAQIFENISSLGWINFSGLFLVFAGRFTGKNRGGRFIVALIALCQGLFLILQWTGHLFVNDRQTPFGWTGVFDTFWEQAFATYYLAMVLTGLYWLFDFQRKHEEPAKRQQARILLLSALLSLVLASFSNVVLPKLGWAALPQIGDVFVLCWAVGVVYAMSRYHFLSISPSVAADQILRTMSDAVLLLDLKFRVVYANSASANLLRCERESLVGRPIGDFLTGEDERTLFLSELRCFNEIKSHETRLTAPGGEPVPVSLSASFIPGAGYACVCRDIRREREFRERLQLENTDLEARVKERTAELTRANENLGRHLKELERIQRDLTESQERFKTLFDQAPDGYFLLDLAGNIVDGNRRIQEMIGRSLENERGKSILTLGILPLEELPKVTAGLAKGMLGQPMDPKEFRLLRPDGTAVLAEVATLPMTLAGRKVILGIARDITTRRKAEEERRELEERLRQAQKLESVGLLAGGIAHDFKNYLGAMSGYAEMIRRDASGDPGKIRNYAEKIVDVTRKASDLIANLLAFARKSKPNITRLEIHSVIQELLDLVAPGLPTAIRLERRLSPAPFYVMADRTQLHNALLNIVVNARDAMPRGGLLTVTTEMALIDREYAESRPYAVSAGPYVRISLRDTGIGMDESVKERIFEPFFTTKEKERGTGLGLSSAYGIVKSHSGYIDVVSEVGKGSVFHLYLPLVSDEAEDPVPPSAVAAPLQDGRSLVLLADDDAASRDALSALLDSLGYAVLPAKNGLEALDLYRSRHPEIAAVILDVVMPQMRGPQCLAEIRRINPAVKSLFVTGYTETQELQGAFNNGVDGFLVKPIASDSLSRMLDRLTRRNPAAVVGG